MQSDPKLSLEEGRKLWAQSPGPQWDRLKRLGELRNERFWLLMKKSDSLELAPDAQKARLQAVADEFNALLRHPWEKRMKEPK